MCICLFALVLLCDFHNKFYLLINWLSYQFLHCFVEDLVVYKDISILHALYVCIWYVFNKLSSLNKDFIIIVIIIVQDWLSSKLPGCRYITRHNFRPAPCFGVRFGVVTTPLLIDLFSVHLLIRIRILLDVNICSISDSLYSLEGFNVF